MACSGEFDFISVLAAVEATPAAPVLASLAASTASPRAAGGARYGSQASETEARGDSRWHFKSKN
jgi:hypothetical protein